MISNEVLEHVNKCLEINRKRNIPQKRHNYNNLEIAAFMSIIFNEKYNENDIQNICIASINKIRNIVKRNDELKDSLLSELLNSKVEGLEYVFGYTRIN